MIVNGTPLRRLAATTPGGGQAMDKQRLEAKQRESELRVADTVGVLMEFWGFKRALGRVWTLLYLSPEPLGAADIAERVQMSAGAVSMALTELQKWGAVRRSWRPGERRDFFECETSIWKMITRVFRERELGLVRDTADAFSAAEESFAAVARSGDKELKRRVSHARERLARLRLMAKVGESLLTAIVAGNPVDTGPLQAIASAIKENK